MSSTPRPVEPILDYAAPRKHSRMRLPAESTITVTDRAPGRVVVTETLAGANGAVGALVFAGIILLLQLSQIFGELSHYFSRHAEDALQMALLLSASSTAIVVTMVFVILQTWRKTIFHVHDQQLTLAFAGLFSRRSFTWPADEVALSVLITHPSEFGHTLGELQLQPVNAPLFRLLTDHRIDIVTNVHRMLEAALTNEPVPTPIAADVDPAALSHLRQKREEWSSRLH